MKEYVIYTDSACDIDPKLLSEWGVGVIPLTFRFSDEDKEYTSYDMESRAFYDRMRSGGVAKTAAINSESFAKEFEKVLAEKKDVLYLSFSSGLSTTFNSSRIASEQLAEKYTENKVYIFDTLAASAGQGLLVKLVVDKKNEGADVEQALEYAKSVVMNICHWFTVDDLVYLKRGGRISSAAAFFGTVIGIKPVLHVDNDGHLINVQKVRGRKSAIAALADQYGETALDKENGTVFISHADCESEARSLAEILSNRYGASVTLLTDISPVIGAHSGPGTIALFFVGSKR